MKTKPTEAEKLILIMLCDVYEALKITNQIDPKFIRAALTGGHYWAIDWQYQGLTAVDDDTEPQVKAVANTLEMWSAMLRDYAGLSMADKTAVDHANHGSLQFPGFDGNNETEQMSIARFLTDQLERFDKLKGKIINSHSPTVRRYQRMYSVFEPLRASGNLTADQIIKILAG